jgi:hypothetical protein
MVGSFMCPHLGQRLLYVFSFVNNLPEDGLNGPKHVGGPSQGSKLLFVFAMCSLLD